MNIPDMGTSTRNNKLGYILPAAAVTAGATALYIAAARVPRLGGLFDALGPSGLWLKYALCFAAPAVFWAVALAYVAPRVALRVAGLVAQKWSVYLVVAVSLAGIVYVALAAFGERQLTAAEAAATFQSKIFCRGKLAAPAPPTEADVEHAFFRSGEEVVRYGRWYAAAAPLHPLLLCLGRLAGWPKLAPLLAAAVTLVAVYAVGRRALGIFGGGVAAALAASSPAYILTQASFLPGATFVCLFALAAWACWEVGETGSKKAAAALGVAAGAAFLASAYSALALALPFVWYLWRRTRGAEGRAAWPRWLAAGLAPFVAAWLLYNWRQTGNVFLPPRFFAEAPYLGFGDGYGVWAAAGAAWRGVLALSTEAFGWPLVCLVPAVVRLFWRPRPSDFEKALYAAAALNIIAQLPLRDAAAVSGGAQYYPTWFCLIFITAHFFVILAAKGQSRFREAGEGLAAFVLAALIIVSVAAYLPGAPARFGGEARGAVSPWTDPALRRYVAAAVPEDAVVIVKPRELCLTSPPGSPFLDDRVVFARDNGEYNPELAGLFPGRQYYLLDYRQFRRTGELEELAFRAGNR